MNIRLTQSPNFGWNIKTHLAITEVALKDDSRLPKNLKRYIARASELPDLDRNELEDLNSAHFYDALHEDPSFGTVNDDKNNALSKFLEHNKKAKKAAKNNYLDLFLKEVGYALHFLQDGGTPPHTEHGNYLHKLFRLPMHVDFERGKKRGASSRLDILKKNYKYEYLPFSDLKMLFHNTALYTLQPENLFKYTNRKNWNEIQQRCFNRGVNASKEYLNYILEHLPK